MRTITTYDRVTFPAERKVTCPGCGRKRTIRRTFSKTVNPFNLNFDGTPKTHREVRIAVKREAAAWEPSGLDLYHGKCWEDETDGRCGHE